MRASFRESEAASHIKASQPPPATRQSYDSDRATVSDSRKMIQVFIIHSIPIHNNNVNKTKQTEKYTMLFLPEVPVHLYTHSKHAGGAGEVSVGHPAG